MPHTVVAAALRQKLGWNERQLPDNATEAEVTAAIASLPRRPVPPRVGHDREPPGALSVSERESILASAVGDRKFSPERAAHWRQELIKNPTATKQVIAIMAPAFDARSSSAGPIEPTDEAYPAHWLGPIEAGRQADMQLANPPKDELPVDVRAEASLWRPQPHGYTSSVRAADATHPSGQEPLPPPGPVTFEEPGMGMAFAGEGWRRDRQIEHERGEAFARP